MTEMIKNKKEIAPIARIRTDFRSKFGVPRQSGLVGELYATVVFEPEFRNPDALRGLESFSHIWVIWGFSEAEYKGALTVRPPRLGGNRRMGVFATRSPFRPNGLGLSSLRLVGIEEREGLGLVLIVSGADMMDGTPIYDIKPYLAYTDSHEDAIGGFADERLGYALKVEFPKALLALLPEDKREGAKAVLAQDPRPAYQEDPTREYGFNFCGYEIEFTVKGDTLTVFRVTESSL